MRNYSANLVKQSKQQKENQKLRLQKDGWKSGKARQLAPSVLEKATLFRGPKEQC